MARNNSGRSTTGERKVPAHYPTTPDRETATYLRLTAARYLSGRANRSEVDEAYRMFAATAPKGRVCSNPKCEKGTIFEGSCLECDQEIRRTCPTCGGVGR
jgi:hypothetical protein